MDKSDINDLIRWHRDAAIRAERARLRYPYMSMPAWGICPISS